jgi:hypothetical protein
VPWCRVLLIRPLRVRDLEEALEGSYYSAVPNIGGNSHWVVRRGCENSPPPGWVKEAKRLVRNVPKLLRKVYNPHGFEVSDADMDHLEESLWPNQHSHTVNDCKYGAQPFASVHYYHCPSGRTYTLYTPQVMNSPSWIHGWCLTPDWVAPLGEPKTTCKATVWPEATAEPVIQIAKP